MAERRVSARRGLAAARATLAIERVGDRYVVDGREFIGWEAAIEYVLQQPPEGEQ